MSLLQEGDHPEEIPHTLFIYLFTHLFISGFGLSWGEHKVLPEVGGGERQRGGSVMTPPFCPQHFTCLHFAI